MLILQLKTMAHILKFYLQFWITADSAHKSISDCNDLFHDWQMKI
jgi:hypothetical protein